MRINRAITYFPLGSAAVKKPLLKVLQQKKLLIQVKNQVKKAAAKVKKRHLAATSTQKALHAITVHLVTVKTFQDQWVQL